MSLLFNWGTCTWRPRRLVDPLAVQVGNGRAEGVFAFRHGREARVDGHVEERPARRHRAVELDAVVGVFVPVGWWW